MFRELSPGHQNYFAELPLAIYTYPKQPKSATNRTFSAAGYK